jgi:hypothetical protein
VQHVDDVAGVEREFPFAGDLRDDRPGEAQVDVVDDVAIT